MHDAALDEKLSFEILGWYFSAKFHWGSFIVSITKTASEKIGDLTCSMKFLSSERALYL